jgi:hypothetical protein
MDFSLLDKITELSKSFGIPFQKQTIVKIIQNKLELKKNKKVLYANNLILRFSSAKKGYSNTFLSFKRIIGYDDKPIVACIIRNDSIEFLLANSTFINCISHSSKNLNIRGSANLTNIVRHFSGLNNEPRNFEKLFKMHLEIPRNDNIERIVEATYNIKGRVEKFAPNEKQLITIYNLPQFIKDLEKEPEFLDLERELLQKVKIHENKILKAATIDNVNIRGNKIEQIVTEGKNEHELGDILKILGNKNKIIIDVKSKLLNLSSAPKAYNIDKLLVELSKGKTYFGYLFVGVDDQSNEVKGRLINFLDKTLIENTQIQHHWSGQNSRGTAQLNDNIKKVFDEKFQSSIDLNLAKDFLKKLVEL